MYDFLTDIGTGIADTVSDIGTGIADAAEFVFEVGEDVIGDVFNWTDTSLSSDIGPSASQDTWSAGNLGADGWGSDGWDNAPQATTIIEEGVSNKTFGSDTAGAPAGGLLSSGGWFTKDDIKGGAAAFARGYFENQQANKEMDWRRDLELEKIAEQKRHHGAYYVGSDVRPAYAKPLEKK